MILHVREMRATSDHDACEKAMRVNVNSLASNTRSSRPQTPHAPPLLHLNIVEPPAKRQRARTGGAATAPAPSAADSGAGGAGDGTPGPRRRRWGLS